MSLEMFMKYDHQEFKILDSRQYEVLKLRYGVGCDHSYSLEEVARTLKVTRERARQIEHIALGKLRELDAVTQRTSESAIAGVAGSDIGNKLEYGFASLAKAINNLADAIREHSDKVQRPK